MAPLLDSALPATTLRVAGTSFQLLRFNASVVTALRRPHLEDEAVTVSLEARPPVGRLRLTIHLPFAIRAGAELSLVCIRRRAQDAWTLCAIRDRDTDERHVFLPSVPVVLPVAAAAAAGLGIAALFVRNAAPAVRIFDLSGSEAWAVALSYFSTNPAAVAGPVVTGLALAIAAFMGAKLAHLRRRGRIAEAVREALQETA